jgi:preprotein translocase subunit YajC
MDWAKYGNIIFIVLMLGMFYLIIFLPESKRRKKFNKMISDLKVNDEVMTKGGIIGKIITVKDEYIVLESGPDRARIKLNKNGISNVYAKESSNSDNVEVEKKDK